MTGTEVRTRGEQGPEGRGEVRLTKKEVKIVTEDGTVYTIAHDAVAEGVKVVAGPDFYFRLSFNEDRLYALRPWSGTEFVKFVGFARARDEKGKDQGPALNYDKGGELRKSSGGGSFVTRPRYWFTALFEIVSGKHEGMQVAQFFDYRWEEGDDGIAFVNAVGKRGQAAYEFYRTFGYDFANDSLAYKKNLLPDLEKVLVGRKKIASVQIEEGRLRSFGTVQEDILRGVQRGSTPTRKAKART